MTHVLKTFIVLAIGLLTGCASIPEPPNFNCISPSAGTFRALSEVIQTGDHKPTVYGFGLTYRGHIEEVTTRYCPRETPPIFLKNIPVTTGTTTSLHVPNNASLLEAVDKLDPCLRRKLATQHGVNMTAALDYEVELGIVLLEDVQWEAFDDDPNYAPRVGYLLANDFSSRSLQSLGEDDGLCDAQKYRFWSAAKNFPGFLPVTSRVWVPDTNVPNGMYCVEITCELNGKVVQKESTENLLFTIRGLLQAVCDAKGKRGFPTTLPKKGDILLTGTPGGVAIGMIPQYKRWFSDWLPIPISRMKKLRTVLELEKKLQDSDRRPWKRYPQDSATVNS